MDEPPQAIKAIEQATNYLGLYRGAKAHEVFLRFDLSSSELTIPVVFDFVLNGDLGELSDGILLECGTGWPPTKLTRDKTDPHPLVIEQLSARSGDGNLAVKADMAKDKTCIRILANQPVMNEPIRITFTATNALVALPERAPFARHRLTANFDIPARRAHCLVHLTHPDNIALRGRRDDSTYYSVALDDTNGYQRHTVFFPPKKYPISMRYTFGSNDASILSSHLFPPIYAAYGWFGTGFSIQMLDKEKITIAAVSFSFVVLTLGIEAIRKRRIFFPSAITGPASFDAISTLVFTVLHALAIIFYTMILIWPGPESSIGNVFSWFAMSLGAALFIGVIIYYYIGLHKGRLQKFACDWCEKRIRYRMDDKQIYPEERRRMCDECYVSRGIRPEKRKWALFR